VVRRLEKALSVSTLSRIDLFAEKATSERSEDRKVTGLDQRETAGLPKEEQARAPKGAIGDLF
jgi:hypothetical protein